MRTNRGKRMRNGKVWVASVGWVGSEFLQLRLAEIEISKRRMEEKKVWIEDWVKRRKEVEAQVLLQEKECGDGVEDEGCYKGMKEELKEMKNEMMQVKISIGRDMKKIKKREQKNGAAKKKIKNKIRE